MKKSLSFAVALLLATSPAWSLAPSQLTAAERTAYDGLKADPVAGAAYLSTRGYLKLCQKVAAKTMPALSLTDIPETYNDQYLSKAEQAIVDQATNLRFAAMLTAPLSL
jgi:hypothetical protein